MINNRIVAPKPKLVSQSNKLYHHNSFTKGQTPASKFSRISSEVCSDSIMMDKDFHDLEAKIEIMNILEGNSQQNKSIFNAIKEECEVGYLNSNNDVI
jgi:hypothetical protein